MPNKLELNHVSVPLFAAEVRGSVAHPLRYIGSATIIGEHLCTAAHVVRATFDAGHIVLAQTYPGVITCQDVDVHPRWDFAILKPTGNLPDTPRVPIYVGALAMSLPVYAMGYHEDDTSAVAKQAAPRSFSGNITRVNKVPNGKSPSICELSFPTLAGFSGTAVVDSTFKAIIGMVYGNVEQSITVFAHEEVAEDGAVTYMETVKRIMDLGLFHGGADVAAMMADMGATPLTIDEA
jgi:hypothetical protein